MSPAATILLETVIGCRHSYFMFAYVEGAGRLVLDRSVPYGAVSRGHWQSYGRMIFFAALLDVARASSGSRIYYRMHLEIHILHNQRIS